jgi:streptogramin lyase
MLRRDCLKLPALALAATPGNAARADAGFPTVIAGRVERMFKTPGPQPNGLQATAEGLWILDQRTNHASLVRYEDGGVIRDLPTETDRGSGITFDGSALWIASTYSRMLAKVDAQTGKTIKQFPSPDPGVVKWGPRSQHPTPSGSHGMEWRRGELWVANPPSAKIYVVNPEDGKAMRSFPAPGVRPHGIGWDADGSLWCTESIYRSFFKMDPKTGRILKSIMLPPLEPEADGIVQVPHGMSIRGRQLWFSVAETAEVYRIPL